MAYVASESTMFAQLSYIQYWINSGKNQQSDENLPMMNIAGPFSQRTHLLDLPFALHTPSSFEKKVYIKSRENSLSAEQILSLYG